MCKLKLFFFHFQLNLGRRRDKNAVINLILGGSTSGGHRKNAMVIIAPNKNKCGKFPFFFC